MYFILFLVLFLNKNNKHQQENPEQNHLDLNEFNEDLEKLK